VSENEEQSYEYRTQRASLHVATFSQLTVIINRFMASTTNAIEEMATKMKTTWRSNY